MHQFRQDVQIELSSADILVLHILLAFRLHQLLSLQRLELYSVEICVVPRDSSLRRDCSGRAISMILEHFAVMCFLS